MTALLSDVRKTARIAGAAMAAAALWGLAESLLMRSTKSWDELLAVSAIAILTFIFAFPLPVFLLLLGQASTSLDISGRLRNVTWSLVAIRSLQLVNSAVDRWRASGSSTAAVHAQMAAQGFTPFALSPVTPVISNAVALVSGVAFILFLVALARQENVVRGGIDERRLRRVRRAARVASIASGIMMAVELIAYVFVTHMMRDYAGPRAGMPTFLSTLRGEVFLLPGLLMPLIVRASLQTPPESASPGTLEAQPALS